MRYIFLILLFLSYQVLATTYYIDGDAGDDSRTSVQAQNPATPWRTYYNFNHQRGITLFNETTRANKDTIKFKAGSNISRIEQPSTPDLTDACTQTGADDKWYHWTWRGVQNVVVTTYKDAANPYDDGITNFDPSTYGGSMAAKMAVGRAVIDGMGCDALRVGKMTIRDSLNTDDASLQYTANSSTCSGNPVAGQESDNLEFYNLHFTSSAPMTPKLPTADNDNEGYIVGVTNYSNRTQNLKFSNCEVSMEDAYDGAWEEAEGFTVNADTLVVEYLYMHGNLEQRCGPYGVVTNGILRDSWISNFYMAGVRWVGDNNDCYRNTFVNVPIAYWLFGASDYINIFSNLVIQTADTTTNQRGGTEEYPDVDFNAAGGAMVLAGGGSNNIITNNTVVYNGKRMLEDNQSPNEDAMKYGNQWDNMTSNINIKNNITYFYNLDYNYDNGPSSRNAHVYMYADGTYPTASHNLYYTESGGTVRWYYGGTPHVSSSTWSSQTGETNISTSNPDFADHTVDSEDPADYQLLEGSPAIGGGTSVSLNRGITLTDFYGDVFTSVTMGAFQIVGSAPAPAQTHYYINSSTGDDNNDGSLTTPFESWDPISGNNGTVLNSGDTVSFYRGLNYSIATGATENFQPSYANSIIYNSYGTGTKPNIQGTSSYACLISGYGSGTDPADSLFFEGLKFSVSGSSTVTLFSNAAGDYLTIDSCEFDATNTTGDIMSRGLDGLTVRGSYLHDGDRYGIRLAGNGPTIIEDNIFEDFHTNGGRGIGINLEEIAGKPDSAIIRRNQFIDCTAGIRLQGINYTSITYNSIANTTSFTPASTDTIFGIIIGDDTTPSAYTKVYNNSISLRGTTPHVVGIMIESGAGANSEFKNNIVSLYDESGDRIIMTQDVSTSVPTGDYNLHYSDNAYLYTLETQAESYTSWATWLATAYEDANSINYSPMFTDSSTGDLNLLEDSEAIEAGVSGLVDWYGNSIHILDVNGYPIIDLPDIGAYEYQSGFGPTYYIDAIDGLDTNPGSNAAYPWQTINKVNNYIFEAGDSILFNKGDRFDTYTLNPNQSNLNFGAYGTGADPILDGEELRYAISTEGDTNITYQDLDLRNGEPYGANVIGGISITFNRCSIDSLYDYPKSGIAAFNSINLVIDSLTVSSEVRKGVYLFGCTNFLVEHGSFNAWAYHIDLDSVAGDFSNGVISKNQFLGAGQSGFAGVDDLEVHYNSSEGLNNIFKIDRDGTGIEIHNNTFYNEGNQISEGSIALVHSTVSCNIYNNIFYHTNDTLAFIRQDAGAGSFTASNNQYYNSVSLRWLYNGVLITDSTTWVDSSSETGFNATEDPEFNNLGGGDYSLTASSWAIDKGLTHAVSEDYVGNPVPDGSAPDVGAYEYEQDAGGYPPTIYLWRGEFLDSLLIKLSGIEYFTAGEDIDKGEFAYYGPDEEMHLAQGNAVGTCSSFVLVATADVLNNATGSFSQKIVLDGFTGLTPGDEYYLSTSTAGGLTTTESSTSGHVSVIVGVAKNATTMRIEIDKTKVVIP